MDTSKVAFSLLVPYFAQRAMNLRRCFAPRQLLFLLAAGLLTSGARLATGQDTITLRGGQPQQATIQGVTSEGVKIQMGDAVMVQPFSNIVAVTMNPPPDFTAAEAAYESGDLVRALKLTKAVITNFRALPTDWAKAAMIMLGDIDMALGGTTEAQAAYKDYQAAYPGVSSDEMNVGLANIDLANNDSAAAAAKLQPVLDSALKNRTPPKATAALFGRAFYLSGKIKEKAGDFPGALEDYLRTVTLFPEDAIAAASAQAGADALRKAHGTVAP